MGHDRIDTKAAGVGTPQAAEHRYDFDEGCFPQRGGDELPALVDPRKRCRLLSSRQMYADVSVRGAVLQDITDDGLVGEAQHIVEVLLCILRVAAGVRAAEDGDRPAGAEEVAQGVG